MCARRVLALIGFAVLSCPLLAQEAAKEPAPEAAAPTTQPAPAPAGTWWERWTQGPKATGNWGGVRDDLACKGINFNLDVTQILQQNAHGGADTHSGLKYSGSADLTVTIDTEKLGLWPGGMFLLNGEPRWGKGVNSKVGSLIPVNLDAFKPAPDEELRDGTLGVDLLPKLLQPQADVHRGQAGRFAARSIATRSPTMSVHSS